MVQMLHLLKIKTVKEEKPFSLRKLKRIRKRSQEGLTILESLVGILVITLVLAASTPPILMAAASRVQNQRTEQAIQLAQQEIDRVRLLIEQGDYLNTELPPPISSLTNPNRLSDMFPPTSICSTIPCTPSQPSQAKRSEDGQFIIQTFRDPGVSDPQIQDASNTNTPQILAFRMGVRVYSRVAEPNLLSRQLTTELAPLQITNSLAQQSERPLAVLYADFARGDLAPSLRKYREFLLRAR
jgi:type II secretory pathway pseudopilin PulG